ncbi:MAG: cyclic pyranopterin monophosphate synthase MoaC [Desulfurococcales archaeon]|nr:cyclic pyranopterin monophosphate synthase MoaC [Desulfurococcales archaeon]
MRRMVMIDVSEKPDVYREAVATGRIRLRKETIRKILNNEIEKGNVIETARIAGILAAKKTSDLIPLTHPIPLTHVSLEFNFGEDYVEVRSKVSSVYKTGVEIEALVSVATALITIWDMIKKYEKDPTGNYPETLIEFIKVEQKIKREI